MPLRYNNQTKHNIQAEAHRLGFSLFGVTTPARAEHFDAYKNWINAQNHGEMTYLATDRALSAREDPREVLPECRSILCLAMPYTPHSLTTGQGCSIAAYAVGQDYHEIILPRLQSLAQFIAKETHTEVIQRGYTDTGPIMERDLACRAGLGWQGKNSCLIHPRMGSYFFLAELLISTELEPDLPFQSDHCGTCQRCIEACPTGCILPNRTIDARRCISYLTIELKQAIPSELRPAIGSHIFGCDICQQVCPWNREKNQNAQVDPVFTPAGHWQNHTIADEFKLDAQGFNHKFRNSPIQRTKRRGYLRNLTVAAGNLADPANVAPLSEVLKNEAESLVRQHAAWALGRIGTASAVQVLKNALRNEQDPGVFSEIECALSVE